MPSAPATNRSYSVLVGAAALLAAVSIVLISIGTLPLTQSLAAILILWIAVLPGILHLASAMPTAVPLLPAVGIYYALFFSLPAFAGPFAYRLGDQVVLYLHIPIGTIAVKVLLLVAGAVALMWLGYYVAAKTFLARLPQFRMPNWPAGPPQLTPLYVVLLGAALTYRYSPALHSVPSIGQFLDSMDYVALGGLFLQWRAGRLRPWLGWTLLLVVVPLDLQARLRYLYFTDVLLLGLFFGFVLWRARWFRALAGLAALAAVTIMLYGAAGPIRYQTTSVFEHSANLARSVADIWRHDEGEPFELPGGEHVTWDRRFSPIVNRMAQIWIFQTVFERTPAEVPYWDGETYRPLFTALIPRALYPEKPEERTGAAFGLRYGFLEPYQLSTSVNLPWITELLANFGPVGVLLGMTGIGVLLAFLDRLFNRSDASDLEFLIGLVILFRLAYPESNFSEMVGSLPLLFVAMVGFFWGGGRFLAFSTSIAKSGGANTN